MSEAVTRTEPSTFERIEALWRENPDITYGQMADRLHMTEFEVMGVIQRQVQARADADDA